MKLNCKPGDLAIVVNSKSSPDCIGLITRVVSYLPDVTGDPAWIVDPPLHDGRLFNGLERPGNWWMDAALRPIRDQDGEDEILRIAGKPQEVKA